ncbi:Pentulose kinase [Rhizopus microsporus]|uniref:Pentulose kinase n=1 Tax=Rhizopus microsporus TaxID=58291 RepID=A0A1X0RXW3_RHIZD|nr:Pentulose kinase [Rhizopus microsporus]
MSKENYFIGVDVGTGSARAAVIDTQGKLISIDVEPITTYNPKHDIFEQSTDNIWSSITKCVRNIIKIANLSPESVKGIGFDATCSLVALDKHGKPCSVDPESGFTEQSRNVILWADHRAIDQANRINATHHSVLRYVGNTISPEMEIPKTLWLKENMPASKWDAIGYLMDLPDFLTYKATGATTRSTCSLTCKCSYLPRLVGQGWEPSFFKDIGLSCLIDENFARLGAVNPDDVAEAGDPLGNGLCAQAAQDLGLLPGTPVGSAVIDAYAGALATLGATSSDHERNELLNQLDHSLKTQGPSRLAIICGTSSCHITMSPEPIFVPGVWGPYRSVMVPDMWHAEGGQSSTGQLIDFILNTHPAIHEAREKAGGSNVYSFLTNHLKKLQAQRNVKHIEELTRHLHIYPDFHGNRSPLADPSLRGTIVGVSLDRSIDDLALRYLATLQAIACQTRHIIETLNKEGYLIDTLCMSGGLCKSELFVKIIANTTQCRLIMPESIEGAVVIGAAFLGAKASGLISSDLWEIMVRLGRSGSTVMPDKETKELNDKRYNVFLAMLEDQKKYRQMMA